MRDKSVVDRKIRKKRNAIILVILFLLIGIFFILYTRTSLFHVSQIIINDNYVIEDEKIIMASGIITGENIFKIKTKNAEENLLLHPYIKSVDIKRKLPNKIIIDVVEREEALLIDYVGSYLYVDDEGKVLNILSESKDGNLPEIIGLNIENPKIGEKLQYINNEMLEEIQEFLDVFVKSELEQHVKTVEFSENNKVNIELRNGTKVAFGTLNNVKYKISFLLAIIEDMNKKNEVYNSIDLDKGSNAIIKKDSN